MTRRWNFDASPVTASHLEEVQVFMAGRGLLPASLHVILLMLHSSRGFESARALLIKAFPGLSMPLIFQVDRAFKDLYIDAEQKLT